jgi:hypothetical protein
MPINLQQDLKFSLLTERQKLQVNAWIEDYEAMPEQLRLYMDMFIALLPQKAKSKCSVAEIKGSCEARWGLYYPKTVWFIGLRLNHFETTAPKTYASGVMVNTCIKHLPNAPSSIKTNNSLWLPDLYQQWEISRGGTTFAS